MVRFDWLYRLVGAAVPALMASTAWCQRCGWLVDATPSVSPSNPTAAIRVYAWFDRIAGTAELFHTGDFHLHATDPTFERFDVPGRIMGSDPRLLPVFPTEINDLRVSQIHNPPVLPGNPDNPILVLYAWWRAEEFTPRIVTITAVPRQGRFWTFRSMSNSTTNAYPTPPLAGQFQIRVEGPCYPDCDTGTGVNVLDIFDFLCFGVRFQDRDLWACDMDLTTGPGVCDVFDMIAFQSKYDAGCP